MLSQIGASVITNWGSYYKLGQNLLQIRAAITNWGNYYKLGHNNYAYMDSWKPLIGDDSLRCKQEDDDIHDENAAAVIHSKHTGPRVVRHLLFLYSSTLKKFLSLPNHTIRVLVTGKRINRPCRMWQ